MKRTRLSLSGLLILVLCCFVNVQISVHGQEGGGDEDAPRRTYYGFTPFPYEVSFVALDFTYDKIAEDANLIAHHFDNGVPWVEALANAPYHAAVQGDWDFRKSRTPEDHIVYVSVTPFHIWRDKLAGYRGAQDDMPLPAPWDTYTFDHPDVKAAYLNYCREAIRFFEPDYLNIGIESNLVLTNAPDLWDAYLELHRETYTALKAEFPDLPIFVSLVGMAYVEGTTEHDYDAQMAALDDIMPYTDLFALSLYPYMTAYTTQPFPESAFATLAEIAERYEKPIAIAETGYIAEDLYVKGIDFTIPSDAQKQADYIRLVVEMAETYDFEFVINFVLRDYDILYEAFGGDDDPLLPLWRDTGLYDGEGNPRPALDIWRAAVVGNEN